jgi:hypothetical protein
MSHRLWILVIIVSTKVIGQALDNVHVDCSILDATVASFMSQKHIWFDLGIMIHRNRIQHNGVGNLSLPPLEV